MPLFGPNIAKLRAARDVDGLIKALDHARPEIQTGAARALAEVADPRALPAIVLRLSLKGSETSPSAEWRSSG